MVTLRPVEPADTDVLYRLHSLPEVVANRAPPVAPERRRSRAGAGWRRAAGSRARPPTWRSSTRSPAPSSVGARCSTTSRQPGRPCSATACCPRRGRGLAARTVRLVAGWAFGVGLAGPAPGRTTSPSQRVLERAGWRAGAGRLPGPGGVRVDSVVYGRLATDEN
ncbi:GNAT family protein [Micromonospora sp. BRA006-A]|nr:GNAT family protein [Micromonospora sp. BRA006-A]